jgi:hypothetical protein
VTKWVKPDLDEFYAAPKWLEVDPAIGQTKHLVVSYLFQCEEYVITTTEPGPVSYAILAEHARPSSRPAPVSVTAKTDEVTILASHYGMGNQFRDVTPRVRELLGSGGSFVVDDAILNVNVNTGGRVLVITYSYRGERKTLTISKNTQISRTQLAANAESEVTRYHSSQPPAWLKDADPFAPREPGDPGPGFGQQARRELAIASLLQAVAELKAIAPQDSNREIATTTSITQQALADAQANINRPYPPPSSKPIVGPVRPGPKSLRLANATRALQAAQEQLASAGGGPNELFLGLALEEIQQALAGLRRAMEVR